MGSRALRGGHSSGSRARGVAGLQADLLDPLDLRYAILNPVTGVYALHDPYLAEALCRATNDWIAHEWLDRDPRLRASIVVPLQNTEAAVQEIERRAADKRFVQVLVLAMGELPLGRRAFWPIFAAAERHGLALGIHAGSSYRHAPSQAGFPSYLVEDYIHQSQGFAAQLASLVTEGALDQFPALKVVLIESGVSWLPAMMWRMSKDWRGTRFETPWIKEPPSAIIRRNVRLTTQPFDLPPEGADGARIIEHLGGPGMLMFATDFPHGSPTHVLSALARVAGDDIRQIANRTALAAYPRLEG